MGGASGSSVSRSAVAINPPPASVHPSRTAPPLVSAGLAPGLSVNAGRPPALDAQPGRRQPVMPGSNAGVVQGAAALAECGGSQVRAAAGDADGFGSAGCPQRLRCGRGPVRFQDAEPTLGGVLVFVPCDAATVDLAPGVNDGQQPAAFDLGGWEHGIIRTGSASRGARTADNGAGQGCAPGRGLNREPAGRGGGQDAPPSAGARNVRPPWRWRQAPVASTSVRSLVVPPVSSSASGSSTPAFARAPTARARAARSAMPDGRP